MKKHVKIKLIITTITYLFSVALQVVCFHMGTDSVKAFNEKVRHDNELIEEPNWWERLIGKETEPKRLEFDSSSEWFSLERLNAFDIKQYDFIELTSFIALFTITALCHLAFTTDVMKKKYPLSRAIPLILLLLSGYVVMYEIIAITKEWLILC